jgi:serine-type D-Ala-D-Ala carboxypeptidase (penicillin-binding protein 5/6)
MSALRRIAALSAAFPLLVGVVALQAPSAHATTPIGGPKLTGADVIVDPRPSATPLPAVGATTWVLADLDTGAILAAKGPHVRRPPASTLKALTALTLIPRLDPNAVHTAAYADVAIEGSRVGLVENGEYTIAELFTGLMLQSGNDAAMALANANGGMELTLAHMNEEANRLQAYDTVVKNTSGLPAEGQLSSAYDLALIAREGLQRPDFFEYANIISVPDYPGLMPSTPGGERGTFTIANQNPLLNPTDGRAPYEGAIGLKTGWTTEAGKTFIGAARRGDVALVVTLMNFSGSTYDAAAPLLDWGFANIGKVTPVGYLVDPLKPAFDAPEPAPTEEPVVPVIDTESSTGAAVAPGGSTGALQTAAAVGGNGWAWGLLAAMGAGALLVVMGLRSLHGARRPTRTPFTERRHARVAAGPAGPTEDLHA